MEFNLIQGVNPLTVDLHQAFLDRKLPLSYSLADVDEVLNHTFQANEEDPIYVADLAHDPYAGFEHFYKCYTITEPTILESLFTLEEKEIQASMYQADNAAPEDKFQRAWVDIQQGRMLRIAIMSSDGQTMTSFTQQGISEQLLYTLVALKGIDPAQAQPGNPVYAHYLQALQKAGYL